jgi:hypothetical protein
VIPSVDLNCRTPRTRPFIQGELLLQDRLPNNEFTTRFYDDGRVIESQVPENREQYIYTVRGGSDFTLNDANTITISGVHNYEHHIDVAQVPFILQATGQRERFWFWREDEGTGFTNANVDLTHKFGAPGHELGVNLQFTRGKEDEAYFLNEESPIRIGTYDTHIIAIENTLPLSIDYTRPLPTGRLELGTKLQRRWIPVTYIVRRGVQSVIYPGLGDFSDWDENIFAGYANLVRITPRYTLEGGLRLEETQVSYTIPAENIYYPSSDKYDYFGVFPNAKLTLNLTDRRAVDGIAGDRSRLADDRQRELVSERHRGARYDTVLPDETGVHAVRLEGPYLGHDDQQPFRPASGTRVARKLHPLRVAECAAGARTRPVVARLLRQEAVNEREGRARLHLYRHLQRLRAPARHHRQWFDGALPEFPGDAGRDAGIEVPILTLRDSGT